MAHAKRTLLLLGSIAALFFAQMTATHAVVLGVACGFVGRDHEMCKDAAETWAFRTGNTVIVSPIPDNHTDRLRLYSAVLGEDGPKFDVVELNITWTTALGDNLLTLGPDLAEELGQHGAFLAEALTINDALKGIPFHAQIGSLYYRTDLLEKYGFDVPTTWDELEIAARTIQDGERAAGNQRFWGFLFQAGEPQAIMENASEWIVSHYGASVVRSDGAPVLTEPEMIDALARAAGWIGTISPDDVLNADLEDSRATFQLGDAAFMRNLQYAYGLLNSPISVVSGNVGTAFMPSANGHLPAGVMEGWALAIADKTKHPEAAADLIRYLTSADVQRERAIEANFPPTRVALYQEPAVRSKIPIITAIEEGEVNVRMRPAHLIGKGYAEVSDAFAETVQSVLRGEVDAATALRDSEVEIGEILANAAASDE